MIGVAALMFTACKKDPAENVYLQKMTMESIVAGRPNHITANYVWDNGKIVQSNFETEVMGISINTPYFYEYEGDKLVHFYSVNSRDTSHHYCVYDGDMLKSIDDDGTVTNVISYDKNGNITCFEVLLVSGSKVTNEMEWKNGNLISATAKKYNAERDSTSIEQHTYTYDDSPSAFSHFPIALAVENFNSPATRGSKHNVVEEGATNEYKNGRLVRSTMDGGVTMSYYYTDGVGPDAE